MFDAILTHSLRVGVWGPALEAVLYLVWGMDQYPVAGTVLSDLVPGPVLVAGAAFGSDQDGASR
jgi:hypothetical protein